MKSIVLFEIFVFTFFTGINVVQLKIRYRTNPEPEIVSTTFKPEVISKTCLLKPDPGPCRANVRMYYFDPRRGICNSSFSWGGCQGNGNRFDTVLECEDKCLSKNTTSTTRRPKFCTLTFDYGFCFGAAKRYYYHHIWKTCRETIYSGCGGNKNNFYSLEQCESICRFGHGPLAEAEKPVAGATRKILIINPPNTTEKPEKQDPRIQGKTDATKSTVATPPVTRAYIPYMPNNGQGIRGVFKRK